LTDNSLQSAVKGQQEMCVVAEKPYGAVLNFDTYRNLQRHRAVLPANSDSTVSCLLLLPVTVVVELYDVAVVVVVVRDAEPA